MILSWILTLTAAVVPATLAHRNRVQDETILVISDSTDALSFEDFATADKLTKEELFGKHIPVEVVNDYKSDIRLPRRHKRNGVSRSAKLWPNARIPYAISPHYSPHERALLAKAVKQYHEKTCIRFVPRQAGEPDYLFIGKVDGCFSEVGRTSGVQVLSLDNGCMEYATIIHEMMHVVGFYHEHERWDRDNFIDIIWQNIDRGALDQFGKVDLSKTSYYGQPYDYKSILHYDSLAFSKNGFPTMLPKMKSATIGNARDFSEVDIAKINRMYNCPVEKSVTAPFARARHVPIYSPQYHHKYEDRPKTPLRSYDSQPSPYRPPMAQLPSQSLVVSGSSMHVNYNTNKPSQCEDRITVCWWTADRCRSPAIYQVMSSLCPKTCKFC
uniref:Metalloendopeptidase n=1 Tax=Caenorhabditis japonica TaxID=281687 RepID=A0A8R1HWL7_CAEJA